MELIELVANNQYMFTSERSVKKGVMEIDTMDALLAQNKAITQQLSTLNKKMEKLEVAAMSNQVETTTTCGLCGDAYENQNCCLLRDETPLEKECYAITIGNEEAFQDSKHEGLNKGNIKGTPTKPLKEEM
ncbi:hypothetical protein PIB30_105083, partial [Stylosanthes scabra]|nr:hypothetical protein [Stylosanthes scabra]